mgnify:CR=1 FL=1
MRWRNTITASVSGAPSVIDDDWCLSSDDGQVFARVFKSKTTCGGYYAAVSLGTQAFPSGLSPRKIPSREIAMSSVSYTHLTLPTKA